MAACKKNAARLGAWLVFADESGFLLIPSVCKTWAPRGQTPHLRHRYRRDRLSVISAIAVSPVRQRLRLFWRPERSNIRAFDAADFIRHVLSRLSGVVFVLWDNASIHRGAAFKALLRRCPRLRFVPLPAYAPELNPDEGVWRISKKVMANCQPNDVHELQQSLATTLDDLAKRQALLRSCITHSELPPFLR